MFHGVKRCDAHAGARIFRGPEGRVAKYAE
jgi:hypothetical protein